MQVIETHESPRRVLTAHDVVLRDGSTVHVRPVEPGDEAALHAFLRELSPDSRAFRFLTLGADLGKAARQAADVDGEGRVGILATASGGRIVAHAMYVALGDGRAEIAFAVADAWQGHGLGTLLLGLLSEPAGRAGITRFVALVRADNRRMIEVFRESGHPVTAVTSSGNVEIELPTTLGPAALAAFEDRDRVAATAAVRRVLAPRAIALIGASERPGSVGAAVLANLRRSYAGPLHLINPSHERVAGAPAYRSIADVPEAVELAVVAVPARSVIAVARECARAGAGALLVLSAGFEDGARGAARREELLGVCRDAGMRLVGPNCLGVAVTTAGAELDATFARRTPAPGTVALSTQSGGIAIAAVEAARARGLGFSSVVSIGDRLDLSTNDLLQYWETDPHTRVIALYVESFGNPRNFARIARRVAREKPILAVKAGRAAAGARAAASHTAALVAAGDVSVDALFRQAGVIRTDTLRELLDTAALLASQPAPAGPAVGILTNAGGPGIMCADACEAAGLTVARLAERTRRRLEHRVRAAASVANPVDLRGDAAPEDYRAALELMAADPALDAVVAIFVPPFVTAAGDVAAALRDAAQAMPEGKPLLAVFLGEEGAPDALREGGIPWFAFPEDAALALARAVEYGRWRADPREPAPELDPAPDRDRAATVLAEAMAEGGGWLDAGRLSALAASYRLPLLAWRPAASAAEAARIAAAAGGPVALKAVAPGLLHKTDAGGVALSLRGASAVRRAAARMREDVRKAGFELTGYLVQPMAPPGVEIHVGATGDGMFRPLIACAAGGVSAELVDDVSVRLAPLAAGEPAEMLRALSTFPLLDGYRGAAPTDVAALEDVVARVAALAAEHPSIAEIDCNPVVAGPGGAAIADMRVRVASPGPPGDLLPGALP